MYYRASLDWSNKFNALHGLDVTHPFFDRDFLCFLMSIPGDVVCTEGIPKGLLRVSMKGLLPDVITDRRDKAEVTNEYNSNVGKALPKFESCIRQNMLAANLGLVDAKKLPRALRTLGGKLHDNGCTNAWLTSDIMALELWLQVFFGENKTNKKEIAHVGRQFNQHDIKAKARI
jgi:hypothetical protein